MLPLHLLAKKWRFSQNISRAHTFKRRPDFQLKIWRFFNRFMDYESKSKGQLDSLSWSDASEKKIFGITMEVLENTADSLEDMAGS